MDELARELGIDPFAMRRKNMIRPADWIESVWKRPPTSASAATGWTSASTWSSAGWRMAPGAAKPDGDDWVEGTGFAMAMLECGPPTEHRSGVEMALLPDGRFHLAVGSTEMGNGSVTSHMQIAAAHLGARLADIDIINADTDRTPYDTGTFASTGTVVAGQAVGLAAAALKQNILEFAAQHTGTDAAGWTLEDGRGQQRQPSIYRSTELYEAGPGGGTPLPGQAQGLSVAANGRRSTCRVSGSPSTASPATCRSCAACMRRISAG